MSDYKLFGKLRGVTCTKEKARKPATLGGVLVAARNRITPNPSYAQIASALGKDFGVSVTDETVANYHRNRVAIPNVELVVALVAYYHLTLDDLPKDLRLRCERHRARLNMVLARHAKRRATD